MQYGMSHCKRLLTMLIIRVTGVCFVLYKEKKGDKPRLQLKTCNTLQMSMHICFHVRCRGVKGVVKEAWFNAFMMWPIALNICSVHQMCVFEIWSKSLL